MPPFRILALALLALPLTACDVPKADKTHDTGVDRKHLSELQAGIWIDPNGCDHWIIDDGVEGYLSPRLDPRGRPVCSGIAPPGTATGSFKSGSSVAELL